MDDSNTVPLYGSEIAEVVAAITNASVTKNCIWGIPNSDGSFSVVVADIAEPEITNLTSALVAGGYVGTTTDGLTTLDFETDGEVSSLAYTHVLVNDLWIFVRGTSLDLTESVATTVLDEIRLANPTRTY
ncbi:hypothetical protein [Salinibacterium sp. M195]|uniref:hypothetical protein n=1 Tax=Salinibacterium sp. M195 TaxID=2583374 RepID=UPI001C626C55|nr:hypothetical protein [Salinibacterium sp. M195]QYH34987.1 hypothetical protein FFT87_02930 [Salinibacterium sp. M195]